MSTQPNSEGTGLEQYYKVMKMNNASHHILAAFLCQKLTPLHCSTFRHFFRHHIRREPPNAGGHNPIKVIKSVNNLITSEILDVR